MKSKQNYNIKTALLRVLPLVMLMAPACKKNRVEPTPEPKHYNVVIDWDWALSQGWAPPKDMVKKYTDDKYVDTVFIHTWSENTPGYGPKIFRRARDTLQTRFDIAPSKVRGSGDIYVSPNNGAQLPSYETPVAGMCLQDSVWFANNGWQILRYNYER